ncbi:MAG: peptidoglycan DD-metalloendopeptidase family protein [Candidatus Neomarinimicrobiota bacterium]|nr:peptidoglycan DD-metalloendopeptidase family protein [Candidatus Neomarinimicrobiota bacterium]
MKLPLSEKNYIIHRETETGVRQWHFSRLQVISLVSATSVILFAFLFLGSDYLSKYLYNKRLEEFKSNYQNVTQNLEVLKKRMKLLDSQMEKIEDKDRAVRTYAGMPEIDQDIRQLGIGGRSLESKTMIDNVAPVVNRELAVLEMDLEKLSREVNLELSSYESIYDKVKTDIQRIAHIPSIRPVEGGYLNSIFGYRIDPIDGVRRFHQGQDITIPVGTPIYAPADGEVMRAYYLGGYGNHINIKHKYGYSTIFAHLSKIYVKYGQKIQRGDLVGMTGNTGRSTAPHLHYEVLYYGTPQNPLDYFFTSASK